MLDLVLLLLLWESVVAQPTPLSLSSPVFIQHHHLHLACDCDS